MTHRVLKYDQRFLYDTILYDFGENETFQNLKRMQINSAKWKYSDVTFDGDVDVRRTVKPSTR